YGDHKITWEINRHQHWLALARAFHLTGDRRYYAAVVGQLENWMAVNPPLRGVNWASMLEIGFRCISWTWTLHFFAPTAAHDDDGPPWIVDLLVGLNRQLDHVVRNLSRYFSPNTHLSGEALALYIAGQALPELENSARWAATGRQILLEEGERQVLSDGGHAERSAHYHRYTTDFYLLALLIARLTNDVSAPRFEHLARRVSNYLRDLTDDTGRLPLLGDDDGGQLFPICYRPPWDCRDTLAIAAVILDDPALAVSDTPEEAFWFCGDALPQPLARKPSPRSSIALTDSGYFISRTQDGDHLVVDAGRHGYLNGGHAHADALSVNLTVRGYPLLVDAGTGTYTMDPLLRNHFRSTAMHNSVVVDGRPQSDPGGAFHWRTITDARATLWHFEPAFDYVEGRHAGYGHIVHARSIAAIHGFGWVIVDHLLGSAVTVAEGLWHIHPMWRPLARVGHLELQRLSPESGTESPSERQPSEAGEKSAPSTAVLGSSAPMELVDSGALTLHSPVYGRIDRGHCARIRTQGPLPRSWMTFVSTAASAEHSAGEDLAIESLTVTDRPAGWHAAAFRIRISGQERFVLSAVPLADDLSAAESPARLWGVEDLHTDGRFMIADPTGATRPIRVGGTHALLASTVQ
ncbi:MAG: alginate lyase family protein, partial [Vicinamibacterales bacterium]